jgi:aryl-alcohol dehydrogenase-like predicted oxidoreductase
MRRRVWRQGTISAVGFGAMSFGGFYGPTTESDSLRTLAGALDLGVDFWTPPTSMAMGSANG